MGRFFFFLIVILGGCAQELVTEELRTLRLTATCVAELQWEAEHFWLIQKWEKDVVSDFPSAEEERRLLRYLEARDSCRPPPSSASAALWKEQDNAYRRLIARDVTWTEFKAISDQTRERLGRLVIRLSRPER